METPQDSLDPLSHLKLQSLRKQTWECIMGLARKSLFSLMFGGGGGIFFPAKLALL